MRPFSKSLSFASLVAALSCAALSLHCSEASNGGGIPLEAGTDAGAGRDAATVDAQPTDAARADATTQSDSGPQRDGGGYPHAYGSGTSGDVCEVNANCAIGLRCECTAGNCSCKPGVRGEGFSGVSPCKDGNDCGSSLCIEVDATHSWCSDYCKTNAECTGNLPRCFAITGFAENICAPPASK